MRKLKLMVVASLVLALVACDEMAKPKVPQVAGTYLGEMVIRAPDTPVGALSVTMPLEAVVTQSEANVTININVVAEGERVESDDPIKGVIDSKRPRHAHGKVGRDPGGGNRDLR